MAAAGIVGGWRQRHAIARCWPWLSAGASVFCFQGWVVAHEGPTNFYGYAHHDHVNYVQLAEFLVEKPFSTKLADVGLHPWLVKAIDTKEIRITQCVVTGYTAVATLTDAKAVYGANSVFFVGLLAAATAALLMNCGASRWLALLGGVWAGLLPAITKAHLDAFYSQIAVSFVFPTLWLCFLVVGRNRRLAWVACATSLSFLFGAYTEVYVIGATMAASLALSMEEWPLRRRIGYACTVIATSLLLLLPYVRYAMRFVHGQYQTAENSEILNGLMPRAGTWQGWSEQFVPSSAGSPARWAVIAGLVVFATSLMGVGSCSTSRRLRYLAMIAVPVGTIGLLLSVPVLPKYALGKLLVMYSPLAVVFSCLGINRLFLLVGTYFSKTTTRAGLGRHRLWRPAHLAAIVGTAVFACLASVASVEKIRIVTANGDNLSAVTSPATLAVFRSLEAHPERTYVLKEPHPILNAWLCYHARHANVYVDVERVGDRTMSVDEFPFRRIPSNTSGLWLLAGDTISAYSPNAAPEIVVHNPQGIDRDGNQRWYWVGDEMVIEIINLSTQTLSRQLRFRAISGPALAAPARTIILRSPLNKPKTLHFSGDTILECPVVLAPGSNLLTLAVENTNGWSRIQGDGRKLMVRIQEISVGSQNHLP